MPETIIDEGGRGRVLHGWCLTILAALRVRVDAGACFYGIPALDLAELKKIKMPLICHFAKEDDWCTPAKVNEVEAALNGRNHRSSSIATMRNTPL